MATLEDKILGEKLHNYCSSSEDEPDSGSDEEPTPKPQVSEPLPEPNKWEGTATNTGPKGVLKDWQRFKQLETEKRVEAEKEKLQLMKKLTLSCRTSMEDEKAEDPELAELMDDDFLLEYQKQRMEEMIRFSEVKQFGFVLNLKSGQEFLDAIDQEAKTIKIVVHIYEENVEACHVMNNVFEELSTEYPQVKFCKIIGSKAGMSKHFKLAGVPALLVYKSGQLVGNFVRISDDLGNDFTVEDVQGFLIEHGMLLDKSCVPQIIKQSANNDSGSD